MKTGTILKMSFILSFLTVWGAFLKIIHNQFASHFMMTGILFLLIFICTSIYEIKTSKEFEKMEKSIWILALLMFSSVAGFLYLSLGRNKINSK